MRLESPLVLALDLVIENDTADVGALVSEPVRLTQVGAIELGVVRQLAHAAHVRVEGLVVAVRAVPPVALEEVSSAARERHRAVLAVDGDEPDEPFVAQMGQVCIAAVLQIALGHDPIRADCRECAAIIAIQFVAVVPVEDDFPFPAARQVEVCDEDVTWVHVLIPAVALTVAGVVVALAIIFVGPLRRRPTTKFDPVHFDVAGVVVAIARIEVVQRPPPRQLRPLLPTFGLCEALRCRAIHDRLERVRLGWLRTLSFDVQCDSGDRAALKAVRRRE